MKKISLFFSMLAILAMLGFKTIQPHTFTSAPIAGKKTCPAPTNLTASKSGTTITLSWTSGPGSSWQPGGYYNYYDNLGNPRVGTFGYSTLTWPTSFTVPASTYSMTYRVTITCTDGSTSTSAPYSRMFP